MNNKDKIAKLFEILCDKFDGAPLGKKATQKMFYFFERKGIDLNLRYCIHYFGPYSSKLDNAMHLLESEDYISIDTSGITHIISIGESKLETSPLSNEDEKIAEDVLESFAHKSALELEALTTMDYIANTILESSDKKEIINQFKSIKGSKFNDNFIESTYQELITLKLISA